MAEPEEVFGRPPRTGAVRDPDTRRVGKTRFVDRDHRTATLEDGVDHPGLRRQAINDEAVDRCLAHDPPRRVLVDRREDQKRRVFLIADQGDALQERHRGRVSDRVGQAIGEHHADRAGAAGAQHARHRVRARVAKLPGDPQDLVAQRGRELIRPVEGIGCGGTGDPGDARHIEQRRRGASSGALPHPAIRPRGCTQDQAVFSGSVQFFS
jgi:hypothetical protein